MAIEMKTRERERREVIKRWRADRGHGEAMQAPNKQK